MKEDCSKQHHNCRSAWTKDSAMDKDSTIDTYSTVIERATLSAVLIARVQSSYWFPFT